MSLPSGYKRLEYIKSSGTQYIDSGILPTQNTRIDLRVSTSQTGSHTIAGADVSWTGNGFSIGVGFAHYGTETANISEMNDGNVHEISLNKNVLSVDGKVKYTFSSQTFSVAYSLALFANNRSGSKGELTEATWYPCKIYDNDVLTRDFIPCETDVGAVGLWDDVNGVFYGNAGTGTFTAGPVVVVIPDAPSNLQQTMSVRLIWAEVSGAEQYNVYRDGTLIATTTSLFYVDDTAAENAEYTYAVSAVNSAGESPKTTISVYTKSGYFLYKPYIESATFQ